MKATDLMIGDWVQGIMGNGKVIHIGNPYVIVLIDGKEIMREAKEFQPIPLTPEILEKNGWRNVSTHTLKGADTYRLQYEHNGFDYTITYKLNDYFAVDSLDDRMYRLFYTQICNRWSVHDLQMALKLCKIDKEIVL